MNIFTKAKVAYGPCFHFITTIHNINITHCIRGLISSSDLMNCIQMQSPLAISNSADPDPPKTY
ncbi:hypothetical protein VMF7928_00488 [Vibrio marisflavi CECT 7928]|uniref:Uncharacterized protein n=1 Tax=Vibrio marisflavi CECT 7928 TaxID=634439 RepID=A0ABN8E3N6_9VIBR|nr:hypothetical protein VMF7928_00488 [Vibrio marisflavi CECT 7928]